MRELRRRGEEGGKEGRLEGGRAQKRGSRWKEARRVLIGGRERRGSGRTKKLWRGPIQERGWLRGGWESARGERRGWWKRGFGKVGRGSSLQNLNEVKNYKSPPPSFPSSLSLPPLSFLLCSFTFVLSFSLRYWLTHPVQGEVVEVVGV